MVPTDILANEAREPCTYIIPDMSKWIKRRHGEGRFDLTQFLSEHGGYASYHYRFRRDDSPYYLTGEMVAENVQLVVFKRPKFAKENFSFSAEEEYYHLIQ